MKHEIEGIPGGSDAEESSGIWKAILNKYTFRVLSTRQKGPAVYQKPHIEYSELIVCGDYTPQEQDKICAVARIVRREVATKPIRLDFYPREYDQSEIMRREVIE